MTQKQFEKRIRRILFEAYNEFEAAESIEAKIAALEKQNELIQALCMGVSPEFIAKYNKRQERKSEHA